MVALVGVLVTSVSVEAGAVRGSIEDLVVMATVMK